MIKYFNPLPIRSLKKKTTKHLLQKDSQLLAETKFPIVTLSGSWRDIVETIHGREDLYNHPDIVLSRAHYSMAIGVAMNAWGKEVWQDRQPANPQKAWLVDPTNYIKRRQWPTAFISELVGRVLARHPKLVEIKKNVLDKKARSKLPLADSITQPLLKLVGQTKQPIISFHIEVGNILAKETKKTIVQAVTDPHVREQYTDFADRKNMFFAVFDDQTRERFLEITALRGKNIDPSHVVVTGPFVDPRVNEAAKNKTSTEWRNRPLRIMLTTGGLGTNKSELNQALDVLLDRLANQIPSNNGKNKQNKQNNQKDDSVRPIQILYYAGTNPDHASLVTKQAKKHQVIISPVAEESAQLRLIYADDIVLANELLIKHGFPWADLVLAKPSGDMAYDAAAAGCALLLLDSWGEWEDNIAGIFSGLGIARQAEIDQLDKQLDFITGDNLEATDKKQIPWLETAIEKALNLPPEYRDGAANILKLADQARS